ncbi:MAG: TIGR02452 family protein, partial [Lachnospiraceae bacterium]
EAICRCSTLFPCISDEVVVNQFHNAHKEALKRKKLSSLYNDDCIYTPDVVVFKSDTQSPTLMSEKDWYKVDVISCAAPNLRNLPTNERDPRSGMKSFKIKNQILLDIHKKRFPQILAIAKDKGAEVLILGAFGCGAFQNPPAVVSNALYHVIIEHQYDFKEIELAIYCSEYETKNYDAFQKCFCTFGKY